jgi:Cdc6-like AAA superfamily ATPase
MAADPERYSTAVIGSPIPSWTSFALLESIVAQFGLQPEAQSFVSYMEALNQYLLANRHRICTLIIDDAQNLNKRGQLELLRLVQNLETQQHKLLNLVLFAQLEWMQVLRAAPNFEQRINMTYTLQPIKFEETRAFVEFRLLQAGAIPGAGPEFDEAALRAIHAYAEGSPRVIVTLCRNALLVASQLKTRLVNHEIVLHTIEKTTLPDPDKRARVAAAVVQAMRRVPPPEMALTEEKGVVNKASRDQVSRDQRAAELLLRAARTRQGQGPDST